MNIFDRITNFLVKNNNNAGVSGAADPNHFLRHGRRYMPAKWSTPELSDRDFYTGYGFAVINKRANRSVVLGKKFLYTDAKESIIEEANKKNEPVIHPYLDLIHNSTDFSERDFWYSISTYLDLEGVYYLMAVRAVTASGRVGNIQKFSLLNPYNVRPVTNTKGELGGYVEQRGDKQREIPKEMIIPIRLLNPFDSELSYSLADAARDSQFTMKQANDFAREAIDGNLNAPGILSSAIELPDDQFDNFVARIRNGRSQNGGEPIFGNGAGTVTWVDMQTDLDKAALDKINSINRDTLLAISGLSKTGVGVEESGTGREVSRTQKDDFTENAIMPQIENIIDALNLDYRRYYPTTYANNKFNISLSNPLETNKDAEQADVDIRQSQFELIQSMIKQGYRYDIAAKYAKGLIDVTDLGEVEPPETEAPETPETKDESDEEPEVTESTYKGKQFNSYEGYPIPVVQYLGEHASQVQSLTEEGSVISSAGDIDKMVRINRVEELNNTLIGVVDENSYIRLGEFNLGADKPAILAKLNKRYKGQPVAIKKKINSILDRDSLLEASYNDVKASAESAEESLVNWYLGEIKKGNTSPHADLEPFIESLALPLNVYFRTSFPTYATDRMNETSRMLGVDGMPVLAVTEEMKTNMADFARKEATSHMNTIKTDIENALAKIKAETSDLGEIQERLIAAFDSKQEFRSNTLSKNASARMMSISDYEADKQLLSRTGLLTQAYKRLVTSADDPCEICEYIIKETANAPIPFEQAFASIGDTIKTKNKEMNFKYEDVEAGNVHPLCRCSYELVIV